MARKKGGGGKLNRSEIIQARLDPNLHIAAEIMARAERRTLSSFIEKSIEQAARNNKIRRNLMFLWWLENPERYYVGRPTSDIVTVEKAVQDIGNGHEGVRFLKFATYFPDLLNHDERKLFNNIVLTPYFWLHYPYRVEDKNGKLIRTHWEQVEALEGIDKESLIEYWDRLKSKEVDFNELCELPPGKKINHCLKEDVRAIRKKIFYNKSGSDFEVIYANQIQSFEISPEDALWKKHTKNLTAKKVELKKTEEGSQVIATFFLEGENQLAWFQSLMETVGK